MRRNDLNDGSIKTLLILALLAANIVLASVRPRETLPLPGSAGAPPALFGVSPKSPPGPLYAARASRGARDTAGESPALPGFYSP